MLRGCAKNCRMMLIIPRDQNDPRQGIHIRRRRRRSMKRSWTLWLVFAGCAVIVIAAMAWVSLIVSNWRRQEPSPGDLRFWRKTLVWPCGAWNPCWRPSSPRKNARPYYSYQAFFPAERAYTRMLARLEPNEILIPSPLLTERPSNVRLYFQLGPSDELSSPQIPTAPLNATAMEGYSDARQIEESTRRLKTVCK